MTYDLSSAPQDQSYRKSLAELWRWMLVDYRRRGSEDGKQHPCFTSNPFYFKVLAAKLYVIW
jgi:hypothetical protein